MQSPDDDVPIEKFVRVTNLFHLLAFIEILSRLGSVPRSA